MKNILWVLISCFLGTTSVLLAQENTQYTYNTEDKNKNVEAVKQNVNTTILAENSDFYRTKIVDQKKGVYVQDFYKTHEKRTDPYLVLDTAKAKSTNFTIEQYNNMAIRGAFVIWYKNGQMACKGLYDDGIPRGSWRFWFEQGQKKMSGYYRDGKKEGQWTTWYENGRRMEKGLYHNDKKEGVWINWYKSGRKKEAGRYLAGERVDDWLYWDEYGNVIKKETLTDHNN